MDQALVRQVLASDPLNCVRGSTTMKWVEVSTALNDLRPQPIFRSAESCRQRVKKLVEIYKVSSPFLSILQVVLKKKRKKSLSPYERVVQMKNFPSLSLT